MNILDGLNEPQQTAVAAKPGPTLVLAGPGSGKTRVLTHRIAYLIQTLGVAPWHIMAVTFTNKASREMRERIERMLDGHPKGLMMGTFHSTCARILRRETEQLTVYDKDFVIFDTDDQKQVMKQALKDLNLDDKRFPPAKMLNGISAAKNELITPELYTGGNYVGEVIRRVYKQYQSLLQANNAMDFDDLLLNTVLLFDQRPDVLERYQEQYQHILVDEFQDTNTTQYALLKRLAGKHQNLFAVGDSDQSIYRWRGADFRNISRFRDQYPDAEIVLLEQNYRSTQLILDAAKAVIKRNPERIHKDLFTDRKGGEKIVVHEAYDEREEAQQLVRTIEKMILDGKPGGDVAIMYRTNAQSRVLEEAFLQVGLPYKLVGATRFYHRREIKDLLAYLRLIHNPADSISFNRVINTPTRGIGAKSQKTLTGWAAANGWQPAFSLLELISNLELQHPFTARTKKGLTRFAEMLFHWIDLKEELSVGELLENVLRDIEYRDYINDDTEEGIDRWDNVIELQNVALSAKEQSLAEFLEQVALVSEVDNLAEAENAPTLLTLHAAKGLEFPTVFITGLEDGVLPHSRSMDDMESMAEERRLFYVGVTRAKDELYLFHAFRRTFYGETAMGVPSRFLADLPRELLKPLETGYHSQARGSSQRTNVIGRGTGPNRSSGSSSRSSGRSNNNRKRNRW